MRPLEPNHRLESIQSYSDRKARGLLLRVNLIGGAVILLLFGYLVVSHYQTKLEYLFSSVEESLAQAVIRGDQHILDNLARSIERADDIDAVWVTESSHNDIVGFHSGSVGRNFVAANRGAADWDGLWIKKIISHKISSEGFGDVGTLHLFVKVPALKLIFLGTLLLGIFLFISISFLSAFRRLAQNLSQPIVNLANTIRAAGPEGVPDLKSSDQIFFEIGSVADSFQNLLVKKEESEKVAQASLRDAIKGRIASIVVHDVRQRLHNAFAVVELLKRKMGAQKELGVLHTALTSIDQTIVDIPKVDLTGLSRESQQNLSDLGTRQNSALYPYPVLALIEPIVREFKSKAEVDDRRIEIETTCDDFSLKVAVDAVKFQRIISNLLSNSFKAMSAGIIAIDIKAVGDNVVINVTDTGPGCSTEMLAKIGTFGFTQFASSGSGIGLASSRAVVDSWNGKMDFSSEVEKSFSVTITLPLSRSVSVYADEIAFAGKKKIAVVDDNPETFERVRERMMAEDHGVKIETFSSAEDFRQWCENKRDWADHAVLFDLRLGDAADDGISLASKIPNDVPKWIVTTNWSDEETVRRCEIQNLKLLSKNLLDTVPITA